MSTLTLYWLSAGFLVLGIMGAAWVLLEWFDWLDDTWPDHCA